MPRAERAEAALEGLAETADWYRRNLEDVIDKRPVRGMDEARVGYDRALDAARAVLAARTKKEADGDA